MGSGASNELVHAEERPAAIDLEVDELSLLVEGQEPHGNSVRGLNLERGPIVATGGRTRLGPVEGPILTRR